MDNTKENQNKDSIKRKETRARKERHSVKQEKGIKNPKSNENEKIERPKANVTRRPRRKSKALEEVRFKKSPLKVIPLGGLLEIGKNITVLKRR